jgi:hypothetical protein
MWKMAIDILDQPRGEILEKTVEYFVQYPEPILLDDLVEIMSRNDSDKFFIKNVLELLKELQFLEEKNKKVSCNLKKTVQKFSTPDFSTSFKLSLLNRISESEEAKIHYCFDIIRILMEKQVVSDETFEEAIREARVHNKIRVSGGEEGRAKKQFLRQLLSYYHFLIPFEKTLDLMTIPDILFHCIVIQAMRDLKKKNVNIVLDLLPHIDSHYFPVFEIKKANPLPIILSTLGRLEKSKNLKFSFVGDGGAGVVVGDKKVNYLEEV